MTGDLDPEFLRDHHERALDFKSYLATDPERSDAWREIHDRISLTPDQRRLVSGFTRRMPVIVISGTWCGDCVQQGPLLERIAEASSCIDLRWLDRDEHPMLATRVRVNGGARVPIAIFLSEDFESVATFGDRTLARYRAIAARQLGPSCPLPGAEVATDELQATLADWLDEFERVQLLLRLSPRLRRIHED